MLALRLTGDHPGTGYVPPMTLNGINNRKMMKE